MANNNSAPHLAKKVFITGAGGFIGRALHRRYQTLGANVAGVDFVADPKAGVVAGDLTKPGAWLEQLAGCDLLIHTAAVVTNTATLDTAWQINVRATHNLLAAAAAAGIRRFVHLSSVAAYGFDYPDQVTEDQPLRPMGNTYVDTKIASEHAVLACHAAGIMDCTIIRPTDVYGPNSRPWVLIPLELIQRGQWLLPAHGKGIFSPVYIDDLVEGIVLAAGLPAGAGQIYNIGGGPGVACAEFFGYHARMLGRQKPLRAVSTGSALVLAEVARCAIQLFGGSTEIGRGAVDMLSRKGSYSIAKAERELGYQPATSLEQGMEKTAQWARSEKLL